MPKIGVVLSLAALLCAREAVACAPAPRYNERVNVDEEAAVIVWDAATKMEHFIRRATFSGEGSDFGFLVPTPSVPQLARVDDDVFARMQEKTTPDTVYRTERKGLDWTPLFLLPFAYSTRGEGAATAAAPVEVLSVQKVGGYEAAILDATDAAALNKWLTDNGYATTPDLTAWLDVYVQKHWILSAFKIDKSADTATARTSAVRMSFTTDRPFFPYREPASQRQGIDPFGLPRVLRVWFIGPERVTGRVGDASWTGRMFWSEAIKDLEVGGVKVDPAARMTAFEDHATPRPGVDDLFFERDADQAELVPPPDVEITTVPTWIPADLALLPFVVAAFVWWWRRRNARPVLDKAT
jgi:hypothetical protein